MPDGSLDTTHGDLGVAFAMVAYPVCDPLARYRYVLSRKDEPPQPSGFSAQRLIDSHNGFFRDEAHMAEMSVTRIVASGEAGALPPMWLGQPEMDDNVPAAITDAFVQAYQRAGGTIERSYFPGAKHGFMQSAGGSVRQGRRADARLRGATALGRLAATAISAKPASRRMCSSTFVARPCPGPAGTSPGWPPVTESCVGQSNCRDAPTAVGPRASPEVGRAQQPRASGGHPRALRQAEDAVRALGAHAPGGALGSRDPLVC